MTTSHIETEFLLLVRVLHQEHPEISLPMREFRFHPTRKWRADFAWPEEKLLVECEGGIFSRGRHLRPKGFTDDCVKYNWAALLGYRVLRITPDQLYDGSAEHWIKFAFGIKSVSK